MSILDKFRAGGRQTVGSHGELPISTGLPGADGIAAIRQPIGEEEIRMAHLTLLKYKQGKNSIDQRVISNEEWYRLRHWQYLRGDNAPQVEPVSAWLFNSLKNKKADAMDNFPEAVFLPREPNDAQEAKRLSSIVPVIMEQNDFEAAYDEVVEDKLHSGTGIYGVFWDSTKLNGLGDIDIRPVDILQLFWEPGKRDIQKSRNVFHVELRDNDLLEEEYPQLKGKLGGNQGEVASYINDDSIDTSHQSAVIDWYYKKTIGGKTILHYCKFCGNTVLFSTENDQAYAERGFYDHGEYPFIFDTINRIKGSPVGFGYIDIAKSCQEYIDRCDQAVLQNLLVNATPRQFVRTDGGVNEEEYLDLTKPLIHVDGGLGEDSIRNVPFSTLPSVYYNVMQAKINELKETTGNRDVSTGGTTSGVTAASAIAAMQEAGSKLSRLSNKSSYRTFRKVSLMVVELIRQFYDLPRQFRITGETGGEEFVSYTNEGLQQQTLPTMGGESMYRLPIFDISVKAQKANPYSRISQNELALQFYNAGFFDPSRTDMALATIEMMDFDGKDAVMQKIARNGQMYQQIQQMQQQMMMLAAMVDRSRGGNEVTAGLAQQFGMQIPTMPDAAGSGEKPNLDPENGESSVTSKARQRAAEATVPR